MGLEKFFNRDAALHSIHFLLAFVTILGLHFFHAMWDLDKSMAINDVHKEQLKLKEKQIAQKLLLPEVPCDSSKDFCRDGPEKFGFSVYWSGALWAIIVGLLGLGALGVLIASFVIQLPKSILKWYYLAAAILIVIVACIGLGYNLPVMHLEWCIAKKDYFYAEDKKKLELEKEAAKKYLGDRYVEPIKFHEPSHTTLCLVSEELFPQKGMPLGLELAFRFILFFISVIHAWTYGISFGLAMMGDSSQSTAPAPSSYNVNAYDPPKVSTAYVQDDQNPDANPPENPA